MTAIVEWLDVNGYEPTRYKYNHSEDAVLVTVDFPAAVAADAFRCASAVSIAHLREPRLKFDPVRAVSSPLKKRLAFEHPTAF